MYVDIYTVILAVVPVRGNLHATNIWFYYMTNCSPHRGQKQVHTSWKCFSFINLLQGQEEKRETCFTARKPMLNNQFSGHIQPMVATQLYSCNMIRATFRSRHLKMPEFPFKPPNRSYTIIINTTWVKHIWHRETTTHYISSIKIY